MPGYQVKNNDYSRWWPDEMPQFHDHSLFFDCRAGRDGDQWNAMGRQDGELMPQMHQSLEGGQTKAGSQGLGRVQECPDARDKPAPAPVPGALQPRVYVSKEEMRRAFSLPCCASCVGKRSKSRRFSGAPSFSRTTGAKITARKGHEPCTSGLSTEMPYWLDVDGGMSFGDELITECARGWPDAIS